MSDRHRHRSDRRERSRSRSRDRAKQERSLTKTDVDAAGSSSSSHRSRRHDDDEDRGGGKRSSRRHDDDDGGDGGDRRHHRHRHHHSSSSSSSKKSGAREEAAASAAAAAAPVPSRALPVGIPPARERLITADNFASHAVPFRVWLKRERGETLFDMPREAAKLSFLDFVRAWNAGGLEAALYDTDEKRLYDAAESAAPRTAHQWGFAAALDDRDRRQLGAASSGVSSETNVKGVISTHVVYPVGMQPPPAPVAAAAAAAPSAVFPRPLMGAARR